MLIHNRLRITGPEAAVDNAAAVFGMSPATRYGWGDLPEFEGFDGNIERAGSTHLLLHFVTAHTAPGREVAAFATAHPELKVDLVSSSFDDEFAYFVTYESGARAESVILEN